MKTRKDLVKLLSNDSIKISDEKIEKMISLLSLGPRQEKRLKNFLIEINIPEPTIENLVDSMLLNYNLTSFYHYTRNRNIDLYDYIGKIIDIKDLFPFPDLVSHLMKLVWRSHPVAGEGEAGISILFTDARKSSPSENGDVIIRDQIIEVKGSKGRLMGQKGYGDAPTVAINMALQFEELAQKNNLDIAIPNDPILYNFSKKGWLIEDISYELVSKSKGKITFMDISYILADSLLALYKDATHNELYNWITETIEINGKINKDLFVKLFAKFSFEYYQKQEQFDLFVLINGTKMIAFEPKDFETHYNKFKVRLPTFSHKGGTQGKGCQITLN